MALGSLLAATAVSTPFEAAPQEREVLSTLTSQKNNSPPELPTSKLGKLYKFSSPSFTMRYIPLKLPFCGRALLIFASTQWLFQRKELLTR